MLSFSRISLYRHRRSATHHISAHRHLALYSMLFHVGYFHMKWWLKAEPNHWDLQMNRWKGNCINMCPHRCIAGCDRGHTGIERRMGKWPLMCNELIRYDLKAIRTCTFLQILLGENWRGFQILGTNTLEFPSLPACHHLPPITTMCHFPLHIHHWLVNC